MVPCHHLSTKLVDPFAVRNSRVKKREFIYLNFSQCYWPVEGYAFWQHVNARHLCCPVSPLPKHAHLPHLLYQGKHAFANYCIFFFPMSFPTLSDTHENV
jgi:hypothetical protein